MAGRRTRVKLAPNLGLTRNKNKAVPVTPKIVLKSDTENSESETGFSDQDEIIKPNPSSTVENVSDNIPKPVTAWVDPPVRPDGAIIEARAQQTNGADSQEAVETVEITPLVSGDKPDSTDVMSNGAPEAKTQENVVTNAENKSANRLRVPGIRGRNKFRPNLNFDRSRHGSGGAVQNGPLSPRPRPPSASNLPQMNTRSRTISSSSTNSETEAVSSSTIVNRPQGVTVTNDSPILRAAITTHKPARIRRTTESSRSTIGDRSQFLRRKLDHKKKFSGGVPDRGSLTMFDLIYYNPSHGQRMSVEDVEENVDDPDNDNDVVEGAVVKKADDHYNGDGLIELEEPKSEAVPVPQVKIGVNGELIVDEASLQVETTQAKEAKIMLKNSTVVFESNKTSNNYGRWSKKRRHNDWSQKETVKFFRALSVVGSDFSLMESIFKNRSRQELKLKFKKEEKINTKMVDKCLNERGMFTDLESLMKESVDEDEEEEDEDYGKQRSRPKKKRPGRRRYKNRGYYASSSDGEEADVEASKSPVRKAEAVSRVKRPQVVNGLNKSRHDEADQVVEIIEPPVMTNLSQSEGVLASFSQSQLPAGIQFPPGLLAANPSLVGAKPGSLVVVASPHKPDNPLLSVFMVPNTEKAASASAPASPRHPASSSQAASGSELRLDPAVVRAVDRGRLNRQRTLSESESRPTRKRTFSEMEVKDRNIEADLRSGRVRQRTCSESGLDTRSDSGKKRFLSGSSGKL